jgi:long-chain fatty acid transport protein
MRRVLLSALAVAATTLAPRVASANPLDTFGFGSRGTAMGDAQVADATDFSANYYNPAGLALAKHFEIAIGYFRATHELQINGQNTNVDPVAGLVGGLVLPGKILGVPVAFGLALHVPDDRLSRVRDLPQTQPRWELYDNRNQRVYLAANLALQIFPWLTIGGGLSFMAATTGTLDITGQADLLDVDASELRHEVDADLTAIRYPQFGARFDLSKRVALGIAYRGQFALDLNLSARLFGALALGDASGPQLTTAYYALQTESVDAYLPQQVVVGGSFLPHDRVRVNVDFTWINWSAYITPVANLDVTLDIPPPAGGWPAGITPPTVPAKTTPVPLVMSDRIVPHVGVEWEALRRNRFSAFVRAGYSFQKSPIAPQTGITNYVDRDRHTIAFGAGVTIDKPISILPGNLRFDVHAQFDVLPTGVTEKSDPADLVGDYSAGGFIWNLGATMIAGF